MAMAPSNDAGSERVRTMNRDSFRIYRRRLPHWRAEGATYFVTWRLSPGQAPLAPEERDLVVRSIRHFEGQRYQLDAYVVMDNHAHVLVQPGPSDTLEEIVHSWKSFSAHQLRIAGRPTSPVWQKESFDRIIRNRREFREKMRYIVGNPWKRWPELGAYSWVHPAPPPGRSEHAPAARAHPHP
jgi:REP element-mobilizing transposase RayT